MTKVLFVDDEPTIRLTLPKILEMHQFEVKAAASVQDALKLIQQEKFDVLLSDLNIGEPSDGFTVVSAMRRIQPDAITIILTGYPAFESALQAIREQVDDYISKPANVEDLVRKIKDKVEKRSPHALAPQRQKMTSESLEAHKDQILRQFADALRNAELPIRGLNDTEIQGHASALIDYLIRDLRQPSPKGPPEATELAAQHGRTRREQGWAVAEMVEEARLLRNTLCGVIQSSLLELNASMLVPDMVRAGDFLLLRLRESVDAYMNEAMKKKGAVTTLLNRPQKTPKPKSQVRRGS